MKRTVFHHYFSSRARSAGRLRQAFVLLPAVGVLVVAAGLHAASLPTYDGFDYGAGYDLGAQSDTNGNTSVFSWTHIGVVSGRTATINVASGGLSYPGLATSVGNSVTNKSGAASQGLRYQSRNVNVYGSGVFYSALLSVNSLGGLTTSGDHVLALNNTSTTNQTTDPTTLPGRLWVRKSAVDSTKFNVGVSFGNGTVTPAYGSTDFSPGSTVFVVVRHLSTGPDSLWINPSPSDLGAGSPPAGNIDNTSGSGSPLNAVQSLLIINQTATTPSYKVDEVRLGSSWASVTPAGPPGFTLQPASVNTNYGSTVNFTASAAAGSTAITYVWKKGGLPLADGPTGSGSVISGSGTATLAITGVSQADEGNYQVTASNSNGSTDSSAASLTVADPRITSQPAASNPSPLPGDTVSFTNAAAIGTPTLTYQWQKGGVNVSNGTFGGTTISGADTATLTIQGVRAGVSGDSGSYVLWITNGLGRTASSSAVAITVNDPVIVASPLSAVKNFNDSVTFTATISGSSPPFTYQWKKDGVNINDGDLGGRAHVSPSAPSSATTSTLTIDNLIASDAAIALGYAVTVTDNNSSSASSSAATLAVNDPYIPGPLVDVITNAGSTARLHVQAAGSGTVTYVWKTNGVAVSDGLTPWGSTISGSATDTLLTANVTATDAKSYTVEVSGAGATRTSSASLSVAQITRQPGPAALTVVAGNRAVFSTAASIAGSGGSLTYQWVHNNGGSYAGQTSATFRVDSVQASDADTALRVKIFYDGTDFILSDPVSLTVSTDTRLKSQNLVVYRAGDGSQALTNGGALPASIYFDQFDSSGNYVSTISVPDSGPNAAVTYANVASLTGAGLNPSSLERSADGMRLVFSAFNTNLSFPGSVTAASAAQVPRSVGTLSALGEYFLFKDTALLNAQGYRAAAFDGTNDFWGAGSSASSGNAVNGVYYLGSTSPSSTAISTASAAGAANVRYAQFFNVSGQYRLYFCSAADPAGIYYIAGFPKAGGSTVVTNLTLAVNAGGIGAPGPSGFAVSPDGNTIYVADGRDWSSTVANNTGGIQKWVNGVLDKVLKPDPTSTVGAMHLTADFSANPVAIYAVTDAFNSSQDQNKIVKVVDDGSATGVSTVLATAAPNQCFRAISLGPTVQPPHVDAIIPLPDGNIRIVVSGSPNVSYNIEATPTLVPASWSTLTTTSSPTGIIQYDDLSATNSAQRFYRASYTP